jgi:murein DD-endopeptidase MepM/ murein hydrolase activator NlpD
MKSFIENLPKAVLIKSDKYIVVDLSVDNPELEGVNVGSSEELGNYIFGKIGDAVGYGGYLERRKIYERSDYFATGEERNIHIGLDLWAAEGTEVLAPYDGVVHSFANNTNHGDYGPTIILAHAIDGYTFYTLYGHLSLSSIEGIQKGDTIKQGEVIAKLGDSKVNGDYPPHLHFQIILDIQDYQGDYPGVCSEQELDFYKKNCPDPLLLLKQY